MDSFCERLVHRYFYPALDAVMNSQEIDNAAMAAAREQYGDVETRVNALSHWIRQYKVHRVKWIMENDEVRPTFADAVSRHAIALFDKWHNTPCDVPEAYTELRRTIGELYQDNSGRDRSFRSLTAKVLWCRYPDEVPIYDLFASEATTFLAKIYKAYKIDQPYARGKEENTYENRSGYTDWNTADITTKDIWWYNDFCHTHGLLFAHFRPHIEYFARQKFNDLKKSPSAFRIFDKILWIFGNHDLDYSLMHMPTFSPSPPTE